MDIVLNKAVTGDADARITNNSMTQHRKKTLSESQTEKQSPMALPTALSFEMSYPNITAWVSNGGWIEIGYEIYTGSFVRALDEGGMIWEGAKKYKSVEEALQALERGIGKWMEENY
jgi:hypothetical protein